MIVLKIEMWPRGEEAKAYPLGSAHIWNDATGTASTGNYGFKLFRKDGRQYREGVITKFPRKRLLVWDLLFRVLHLQFAERNKAGHQGEGSAIASETQIASDHGLDVLPLRRMMGKPKLLKPGWQCGMCKKRNPARNRARCNACGAVKGMGIAYREIPGELVDQP